VHNATLRQCLRIYPDDNFNSPDTMDRFDSLKYIDWVPNRYLQQCMDFICSGSPTMTTIIGEFDTPELESARDDDGINESIKEEINYELSRREITKQYEDLNLIVTFGQDDSIDDIDDEINMVSFSEINSLHRNMQRKGSMVDDLFIPEQFDAQDVRDMLDRYIKLQNALNKRGLELRTDSYICAVYVLEDSFEGDNIEKFEDIVDMMFEMSFLFEHTIYHSCMRLLRDSEEAKLSALYDLIEIHKSNIQLPPRLQEISTDFEAMKKYYDQYKQWCDYEYERDDSDNESDDSDNESDHSLNYFYR